MAKVIQKEDYGPESWQEVLVRGTCFDHLVPSQLLGFRKLPRGVVHCGPESCDVGCWVARYADLQDIGWVVVLFIVLDIYLLVRLLQSG